jgi:hypothetical protein
MKMPAWKIVLYVLLAIGLMTLYYTRPDMALLALAPAGLILFITESYDGLLMLKRWQSLEPKQRNNSLLLLGLLIVILIVNVLIALEFRDLLR